MEQGADIYELNTVRKHLSAIKGGQLALAARGDRAHARRLRCRRRRPVGDRVGADGARRQHVRGGARRARRGAAVIASIPTPSSLDSRAAPPATCPRRRRRGDPRLARAQARVIGPQRGAIDGARRAAETLGYHVHVVAEPITGEAREVAASSTSSARRARSRRCRGRSCVIASGETTVTVTGTGKGGRNQEFAFAMARVARSARGATSPPRALAPTASTARPMLPAPSSISQHSSGPERPASPRPRTISTEQQHLRILRPDRRSHSHRSDQHQRRRSPGHSRCVAIRISFSAFARRSITRPPRAS